MLVLKFWDCFPLGGWHPNDIKFSLIRPLNKKYSLWARIILGIWDLSETITDKITALTEFIF